MRTIKFRAFSPIINAMHEFDLEWYETAKNLGIEIDTLGQFTGLKDRTGREIYEGDILQLHEYNDVRTPVIFKRGAFCVHGFNWDVQKSEVIGNIHENPELIKEKDD